MKIIQRILMTIISSSVLLLSGCDRGVNDPNSTPPYTISIPSHSNANVFNSFTKGPRFAAVAVSNTGSNTITLTAAPTLNTNEPVSIVASSNTNVYGNLTPCESITNLSPGQACYIFLSADQTYNQNFQTVGPFDQTLTIATSLGTQTIDIKTQAYLYLGGEFNQLGAASVTSGDYLLAKCTLASTTPSFNFSCSNALSGTGNTPYANNSIYALATDSPGNIYAGGVFTQFGNVPAVTTGILLAKFNPSTDIDSVSNAISDNNNPNNIFGGPEIDAIGFDTNNNAFVIGQITSAGGISISPPSDGDNLLAKCNFTSDSSCNTNVLGNNTNNYVNEIFTSSLSTYDNNQYLFMGGLDQQVISGGATSNFLSCPLSESGTVSTCSAATSPAPNSTTYTTLVSGNNIYVGGTFNEIGSVTSSPSNDPLLAQCSLSSSTGLATCATNALGATVIYMTGGNGTTNTALRALALDNDNNIFIAGKFDTISNAGTPIVQTNDTGPTGHNLLASCVLGGTSCIDLLSRATSPAIDGANDEINAMVPNVEIISVTINS